MRGKSDYLVSNVNYNDSNVIDYDGDRNIDSSGFNFQKTFIFNLRLTFGAILPQIIAAGTVTRRAVEPTWLTASNPMVRLITIF